MAETHDGVSFYVIKLRGIRPLIMHNGAAGLDKRSPANREKLEITRKRTADRTDADDDRIRELECQMSIWYDDHGAPTIPPAAIRAAIETAARKLKQGPQVREGMAVSEVTAFDYDRDALGTTAEALGKSAQFTVPVVVQRNRIERTRAKFDTWRVTVVIEADDGLVDQQQLENWLTIAGRRIGLGDWRPEKSGDHGRFVVDEIMRVDLAGRGEAGHGSAGH